MVGEIRDAEVAQIVGQAAYTGHLVLTSMHTVDAATAITRLTNLGLEPYKIAESLSAVLAQRLLRSLCQNCRHVHHDIEARRRGAEHHISSIPASPGSGCQHCKHTGYAGRVPVAELLTPSDELRDAIVRGATAHEIRAAMRAAGYPTMRDQALRLVVLGLTSIEEVNRVLAADGDAAAAKRRDVTASSSPTTSRSRGCSSSSCSSGSSSRCSKRPTAATRSRSPSGSGRIC